MKNGGVASIEIFWLSLANNASTKSNAIASDIVDWKHHAIEKTVVDSPRTPNRNIGLNHFIFRIAQRTKMGNQLPSAGSVSEVPRYWNGAP